MIIWDNAPCHRAQPVQAAAAALGFTLLPLPGYSPDLNPIEGLWKWMREEVTQLHCYPTLRALFDACKHFIDRINRDPEQILKRLWPKFALDPEFEKLLFLTDFTLVPEITQNSRQPGIGRLLRAQWQGLPENEQWLVHDYLAPKS